MASNRTFWSVVAFALALRAALLLGIGPNVKYALTADSPSYIQTAQNLRTHASFSRTGDVPELYRTPGYPVFLMPFLAGTSGLHYRAVQWAQALLNSLSAGLVYLAALYFWKRPKAALAAGVGLALDFVNAIHCSFMLTDILFVFLLAVVLLFLVRHSYVLAGLATALAAFVRPIGLYYPGFLVILLAGYAMSGKSPISRRQVLLFLIASTLPLALWMGRNHHLAGRWTFSTLQDANLYTVRAALVEMEKSHVSYEAALSKVQTSYAESADEQLPSQWSARYLITNWQAYTKLMAKDMVKFLTGNSMKVSAWAVLKDDHYDPSVIPVHSVDSPVTQAQDLISRHPLLGVGLVSYLLFLGLIYILAVLGMWVSVKQKGWGETLLIFSSIFYFVAVTLGADAQARYRLPIMPALLLFAGGGYARLESKDLSTEQMGERSR